MGKICEEQIAAMKYIAVLLTVHNRCVQTLSCLKHLYTQEIPAGMQLDVFLVDDGCTDGTSKAVQEHFPTVNIIQGDGSLYWNRGMWTAWDVASRRKNYDFYLWLNDDTFLLEDAVIQMLDLSGLHNEVAIVVGATKSSVGDSLSYGGYIGANRALCNGLPCEISGFNGNIVLVPQAVHAIIGNLDYYYRHSKGDYDYALRARKAGIKMYQCGNVLGICDVHEHIATWCNPEAPFCQRWKAMHQPTGMPPNEVFYYERRINILMAIIHVLSIYIKCAFPRLWTKRRSKHSN